MKILIIGNLGSGKTTLGKAIQELTGFKFIQIDEIREKYLRGKVSQEYYCLHEFIQAIETNDELILEFSGEFIKDFNPESLIFPKLPGLI